MGVMAWLGLAPAPPPAEGAGRDGPAVEARGGSAAAARQRLGALLEQDRAERGFEQALARLEGELGAVLARFTGVGRESVRMTIERGPEHCHLELRAVLPGARLLVDRMARSAT